MNTFPLTLYPNPLLRKKAEPTEPISQELVLSMITTMEQNDGVGLAAPQIGLGKQIFLVQDEAEARAFINPRITKREGEREVEEEGCLSMPDVFVPVKRHERVTVECQTWDGRRVTIEAEGLVARIFQHEIDHLQGKLITGRTTPWHRLKNWRKLWKLRAQS